MWAAFATLLALLVTACAEREEAPPPAPPTEATLPVEQTHRADRRALWVLAEGSQRVLEDPARIETLVREASGAGMTDLFVQVYRRGRSWFPSEHADDTPYRQIQAARGARAEPALSELVRSAHAREMRVHAWFNALALARNTQAPVLRQLGREAVLVDREGRSILDYPDHDIPSDSARRWLRLGTPGLYLDPAAPGVIDYLKATVRDLIAAAPELDGLHLDYIRHPMALPLVPGSRFDVGLDFGYGTRSRQRFERESGRAFQRGDAWDGFRRERVNDVVRALGAVLPDDWEYSAAVLPWANRAYLTAMQDWRRWLDEGWMDFVVAMAYTRDDRLLRYLAHELTGGLGGERIWLGLGTWLFSAELERAQAQLHSALAVHPAGVALFSYDALAERPGSLTTLDWGSE